MLQRLQIRRPDTKGTVAALPCEGRQCGRLGFEPFGRLGFQFLHQFRRRERAREPDGEMHMIGNTAYAVTCATGIAWHGGQIGVERGTNGRIEDRSAVFGAKDGLGEEE